MPPHALTKKAEPHPTQRGSLEEKPVICDPSAPVIRDPSAPAGHKLLDHREGPALEGEPSYWFPPTATTAWLGALEREGYCVLKGVGSPEDVTTAQDLLWGYLEKEGVQRGRPSTWTTQHQWPADRKGFLTMSAGAGHCEAAWYLRGLPGVKEAFGSVWGTSDLLVSFDTFIAWRPWWLAASATAGSAAGEDPVQGWLPRTEGYHIDQNIFRKPTRVCVQGMMPLKDVSELVGGLAVVPGSHTAAFQDRLRSLHPEWSQDPGDWCVVGGTDLANTTPVLVRAEAGDLILWDSRLVHGGMVGPGGAPGSAAAGPESDLARLAMTIAMTPRSFASPAVLRGRREALANGLTLTHWPHEVDAHENCCCKRKREVMPEGWQPPHLSPAQASLV